MVDVYHLVYHLNGFHLVYHLMIMKIQVYHWWTNIAMERSTIFNGKIYYFYGHFQ